jgi:transcriptional regulator with XRE-family HTH domain
MERRPPVRYRLRMNATVPIGLLIREWRQRRRLSQLDCACEAQISSRHLSFLETGRAQPSREMLLRLAELLGVPLRERNTMLLAAGYAPMFSERPLDDPALASARAAVDLVLKGHEPFPALAVDRRWTLITSNRAIAPFLAGVSAALLTPPVNVLRLSLHPDGIAPRIVNLAEWRAHLLMRLKHQIEISADRALIELHEELTAYPAPAAHGPTKYDPNAVCVPLSIAVDGAVLSFISTTTVFGTPIDVTLSELALETFFPADDATARALRDAAGGFGLEAGARDA